MWYSCGRWMCHFDDDTYVNIPELVELLKQYKHTEDWYLGKPSLKHPMEISDVDHPGVYIHVVYWACNCTHIKQ